MEELSLSDIVSIAVRRRNLFFATVSVLALVLVALALSWSNYRSTATVEIDQSYIPANVTTPLGGSPDETIMAIADQRIDLIEQKITSTASLAEIIAKFNLYPASRATASAEQLAGKMYKKIKLTLIGSTTSNPAAAQKETAEQLSAIAFTISFDYSDPHVAQQVTDELVTRFLDEDLKERRTQAQEVSNFLAAQISELEASMAAQEKKIADFRAKYGESGPAALMFNQEAVSSATISLQNLQTQLTTNEGTIGNLRSQLAVVDPYSRVIAEGQVITTPAIQLKALQAEYATLTGHYGPEHPDVVKIRKQIQMLRGLVRQGDNTGQLKAQIADVKTNLAAAKSTEGPNNPDVKTLERQLQTLQARLAAVQGSQSTDDGIKDDADNPAYLQLAVQLRSAESQQKSLLAEKATLTAQLANYQKILANNPAVEQQMSALSRDYDNAQLRYRELKEKKQAADMSAQVEKDRKGQRLVVISPPSLAEDTHPSRLLLVVGALAFSVMGGVALIILTEMMTKSVHGPHHLAALTGAAPLVIIPHMRTEKERAGNFRVLYYAGGVGILLIACLLIVLFFKS